MRLPRWQASKKTPPARALAGYSKEFLKQSFSSTMLRQFLLSLLLLAICITTTQAVDALDRPPTPFVPTNRATAPVLSNDYHGNPLGPKAEGHTRILLNNPKQSIASK
jgi:hypothetical protein